MPEIKRRVLLEHKGKQIIIDDFRGLDINSILKLLEENMNKFITEQKKDILLLLDVTDCPFDAAVVSEMHKVTKAVKPYIKKSAVIGVTGLKSVILNTINRVSNIGAKAFKTREEALDWLVS